MTAVRDKLIAFVSLRACICGMCNMSSLWGCSKIQENKCWLNAAYYPCAVGVAFSLIQQLKLRYRRPAAAASPIIVCFDSALQSAASISMILSWKNERECYIIGTVTFLFCLLFRPVLKVEMIAYRPNLIVRCRITSAGTCWSTGLIGWISIQRLCVA